MLGSIWRSIKFLTPSFNRALSKFGYEMAAKNFQFEDWRFMNFGYVYENDKDSPVLEKTDELDRYFIQLYDHLIPYRLFLILLPALKPYFSQPYNLLIFY